MTTLIRRNCPCGAVWYAHVGEPFTDQCNECFLNEAKERRQVMTTTQINNEFDQTPPEETKEETAEASNGHEEAPKTATRKRSPRVHAVKSETNGNGHAAEVSYEDTLESRATEFLSEIDEQLAKYDVGLKALEAKRGRLAAVRARLSGVAETKRTPARRVRASVAPKANGAAKRTRRSSADIQGAADRVVKYLKDNGGARTEKIRAALKIEKSEWFKLAEHLKDNKLVRTRGERRAMEFYVK